MTAGLISVHLTRTGRATLGGAGRGDAGDGGYTSPRGGADVTNGVLVDTSVWIDHFRNHNETLKILLHQDLVLTHPLVIGEIACGTPPAPRKQTLGDLVLLPAARQASLPETMKFIDREALYGMGCGIVEMVLWRLL